MVPRANSIRLHASDDRADVVPDDVYFTFANGRLSYDCVSCHAKCCRGMGYLSRGAEITRQVEMRRCLPLFVELGAGNQPGAYVIANCAPACFFLTEDERCEIHAQAGAAAKPETCRLFPFNVLRRVGRYLIVEPHPSLCPLQVTSGADKSACSDHAALLAAMSAHGITAAVPESDAVDCDVGRSIARERAIASASETFLECEDHRAWLLEHRRLTSPTAWNAGAERERLDWLLDVVAALAGIPREIAARPGRDVSRVVTALTPYLRSRFVFAPRAGQDAPAFPLAPERIPDAIACLSLLAIAAKEAGMRRVTFQTVSKLSVDFGAVVLLLSHVAEVMTWRRDAPIDPTPFHAPQERQRYLRIARELLPKCQRRSEARLGDILLEHLPELPLERAQFLRRAAALLGGNLVRLEDEGRADRRFGAPSRSHVRRLRTHLQRWVVGNLPESYVLSAYSRAAHARRA